MQDGQGLGTRSYRNNNPGNLKYVSQPGTTGQDAQGFAIFSTYQFGFQALVLLLTNAINGQSQIYNPQMTFQQFFNIYAPSTDGNEPSAYTLFVVHELGLLPTDNIGRVRI